MAKEIRKSKIAEAIKNGIDIFLAKNLDKIGFVHTELVLLSNDLRSGKVIIVTTLAGNRSRVEKFLLDNRRHINNAVKERYSSKFIPKITFEVVESEKIDF